jgi:hypothetical protein
MPETELAEAALRSLALRAADHHRLAAGRSTARRGRHRPAHHDTRNGNVLTDCVAVAESFAVARLLALRPEIPVHDVLGWKKLQGAWQTYGRVDLYSYEYWPAFMGYVEIRHALLHGLGRLTDSQLEKNRRQKTMVWIKEAKVHLNGPNVMLNEKDPIDCAVVCTGFVRFLDAAAVVS